MIRVRPSEPSDNSGLLELTRSTPMSGTISLRIDRDPLFERLVSLRGHGKTFVAVESGRTIGCISVTYRPAFVNGKVETIGYLSDLKVDPSQRGGTCAFRLMKAAHEFASRRDADAYFCVVADGNHLASPLLNGRACFPSFWPLGRFLVYSMLPTPFPVKRGAYVVDRLTDQDAAAVCEFVNETNAPLIFSPQLQPDDLVQKDPWPDATQVILVARHRSQIVATATAFDTGFAKANVVIGMRVHLRVIVTMIRSLEKVLPVAHLPAVGEPMRILYLRHVAVRPGHEQALTLLISAIRHIAFAGKYSFVTIGLHERDVRRRILRGIPRFLFISHGYALSLRDRESRKAEFSTGVPVEDFALV